MISWTADHCPTCGITLEGLGRWCPRCRAYTAEMIGSTTDASPATRTEIKDTRTEAEVQLAIRRAAELLGYEAFDLSQGRPTRQPAGIPDLYVRGHGRRVWIEVKRPHGGKLSEHQHRFIASELGNGGEAIVARSVEDFMDWHNRRAS